jgi:predicted ATPase
MITKGWAAPEVARVYTRARALCQQVGETPQLFPVLWGLWLFYMGRGELQTARELGEQLLALAERVDEPILRVQACHALGPTLFWLGELEAAQARLAEGLACYTPQQHSASLRYGGHDPGSCCGSYGAWTLWARGYPDQALLQAQESLRLAQELAHPYTLIWAHQLTAWLHQLRREAQATHLQVEAALPLVREHGFVQLVAQEQILRGWALAARGQGEAGIRQMREGLATWETLGVELYRAYQLMQLAEVYGTEGQAEAGLACWTKLGQPSPTGRGAFSRQTARGSKEHYS